MPSWVLVVVAVTPQGPVAGLPTTVSCTVSIVGGGGGGDPAGVKVTRLLLFDSLLAKS